MLAAQRNAALSATNDHARRVGIFDAQQRSRKNARRGKASRRVRRRDRRGFRRARSLRRVSSPAWLRLTLRQRVAVRNRVPVRIASRTAAAASAMRSATSSEMTCSMRSASACTRSSGTRSGRAGTFRAGDAAEPSRRQAFVRARVRRSGSAAAPRFEQPIALEQPLCLAYRDAAHLEITRHGRSAHRLAAAHLVDRFDVIFARPRRRAVGPPMASSSALLAMGNANHG